MIKTALIACMAAAVYGEAQVFHGVYGHGVGAVPHSVTVKDVVHTPAEVSEVVTPIVHNVAVGYAGHHLGYGVGLGYGLGLGHHIGKRAADADADADAYYGYAGYGGYGYGHHLGYRGYGYGLGYA